MNEFHWTQTPKTSILRSVKRETRVLDPSRIKLARELRGLSKTGLAGDLKVTPRTLRAYESEGAPVERANDLARVLQVKETFFTLPENAEVTIGEGFFRSLRRATAAQRNSARAAAVIGTEVYRFITERFHLPESNMPDVYQLAPAQAAMTLRASWGRGNEPLPNLIQLAEAHGVRVLSLPHMAKTVDAFSFVRDDQSFVFLSTEKTAERSRFDLAHELGHLVMHTREAPEPGADTSVGRHLEKQADEFAAEFLMPSDVILPRSSPEPAVPEIMELKREFKVSAMAMAKRLYDLGRASDWAYRQNCVELAKRGFRSDEPEGITRERSRVFDTVFAALRKKRDLSQDVTAYLGIKIELLHQLTFSQIPISVGGGRESSLGQRPQLRLVHNK